MIKLPALGALTAVIATTVLNVPAVAVAQSNPGEIVVFGTEPCPRSTDDEIVVCKRYPESMRYRMPEAYRPVGTPQQRNSWSNRAKEISVGNTGVGSCSAVGPAGYTGCLAKEINQAKRESREATEQDTAPQN